MAWDYKETLRLNGMYEPRMTMDSKFSEFDKIVDDLKKYAQIKTKEKSKGPDEFNKAYDDFKVKKAESLDKLNEAYDRLTNEFLKARSELRGIRI